MSELGGINQVVHLWEYSSLDDRADVRNKLRLDKDWNENYIAKMKPMVLAQDNMVLKDFAFCPLNIPSNSKDKKVWELRSYVAKPGAETFQKGFEERRKLSEPVGVFYSELGQLNTVVHLWPYTNFEERTNVREAAIKNPVWKQTVDDLMPLLDSMSNKTLIPVEFPMTRP
eukprot:gene15021-17766_t